MKLLLALLLTSCATVRDVQRLELTVGRLEEVIREKAATTEDVAEALATAKAEIREVAEEIEERPVRIVRDTGNLVDTLLSPTGALAGALSLASAVGTHLYRNRQRRMRGEPTKPRRS